jgi:hypothetical protein
MTIEVDVEVGMAAGGVMETAMTMVEDVEGGKVADAVSGDMEIGTTEMTMAMVEEAQILIITMVRLDLNLDLNLNIIIMRLLEYLYT